MEPSPGNSRSPRASATIASIVGGIAAGTSQICMKCSREGGTVAMSSMRLRDRLNVKCVDEQPGVAAAGEFDDAGGLRQIPGIGPGHEFEIGSQAVVAGEVAKRSETIDQPSFFRVVAGDQQLARAKARGGGNRCFVVAGAGIRLDPENLDVEHLDPGIRQAALDSRNSGVSPTMSYRGSVGVAGSSRMPTWLKPAAAAHVTISGGVSSSTVRAASEMGRAMLVRSPTSPTIEVPRVGPGPDANDGHLFSMLIAVGRVSQPGGLR